MKPGSIIMNKRIKLKVARVQAGVSEAKEVQNATRCWQGDGNCILDAQGVIMWDFLAKKSTITVAYYANLLD